MSAPICGRLATGEWGVCAYGNGVRGDSWPVRQAGNVPEPGGYGALPVRARGISIFPLSASDGGRDSPRIALRFSCRHSEGMDGCAIPAWRLPTRLGWVREKM